MRKLIYNLPGSDNEIHLSESVIKIFNKFMQVNNRTEAGGMLFADISLPIIEIKRVTTPVKTDICKKFSYKPDKKEQNKIIKKMFKKDLHFIGEWHTHPVSKPIPSEDDLDYMREAYIKSIHELNYHLMIIVGNEINHDMFWVSLHNAKDVIKLDHIIYETASDN